MTRDVDGLTSATLKHLRERWWDDAFTDFVKDTLQPRPGRRILDVGCGTGTAEVKLPRHHEERAELMRRGATGEPALKRLPSGHLPSAA